MGRRRHLDDSEGPPLDRRLYSNWITHLTGAFRARISPCLLEVRVVPLRRHGKTRPENPLVICIIEYRP